MPTTPKGVFYPDGSWTFPPGLSGSGGAFQTMAESIDDTLDKSGMTIIDSFKLTGSADGVTFSNIPQTYSDLVIIWGGDTDVSNNYGRVAVRMNGDATAGNYHGMTACQNLKAGGLLSTFQYGGNDGVTPQAAGRIGWAGSDKSGGWAHLPQYTSNQPKIMSGWGTAQKGNGSTGDTDYTRQTFFLASARWVGTAAVTSIFIYADGTQLFEAGSTFALFGVPII